MRASESALKSSRLFLSFAVFAATATLLALPLGNVIGLLIPDGGVLRLAAAWGLRGAGLFTMGWLANLRADNLRLVLTRYLLFVFLLCFTLDRLFSGFSEHRPTLALPWIVVLCAVAVVLAGALALPKLRTIHDATAGEAKEHARFLAAAENTLDDFYIFDGVYDRNGDILDFRFSYINPNAERRLRTPREQFLGKILTELRPFMIKSGLIEKYREVVRTGVPFITEVYLDDELIKATWLNVQVVKLGTGIAVTSRDVTENRRMAERIHHLAHHDQLTGVANRTLFQDRAQQALLRARRLGHRVAIFVLDIDCFKSVNDTLGHTAGDALLVTVAQRLLHAVRETDTVARFGGDEFVVLMPEFQRVEDVRLCGRSVVNSIARPLDLAGNDVNVTVSIGASIYPDDGLELDDLMKKADDAMYAVKQTSRDGLWLYCDGMPASGTFRQEVPASRLVHDDNFIKD